MLGMRENGASRRELWLCHGSCVRCTREDLRCEWEVVRIGRFLEAHAKNAKAAKKMQQAGRGS